MRCGNSAHLQWSKRVYFLLRVRRRVGAAEHVATSTSWSARFLGCSMLWKSTLLRRACCVRQKSTRFLGRSMLWKSTLLRKAHSVLRFRVGRSVWCCRAHCCESVEDWYWDDVALAIRKQIISCVCLYARTYARTYVCMHACMHACMCVCMYVCPVCLYVCMYVCMYACM